MIDDMIARLRDEGLVIPYQERRQIAAVLDRLRAEVLLATTALAEHVKQRHDRHVTPNI